MHPVIFNIGPITIYSYGFMVALAFFISTILSRKEAKRSKISDDLIINLSFLIMISAILGARAIYVLLNLREYLKAPLEIIKIHRGGLVFYGGIIMALLSSLIYLKTKRAPILKIADLVFPFVSLGEAIGRVGCFLNGCCYGKESLRFGLYFPVHNKILIPAQIYSSLGNILIFLILRNIYKRKRFDGQIFLLYFSLYPLKRFFIEFLKADSRVILFGLNLFQILNLSIFLISSTIYLKKCKRLISL